MRLRRWGPRFCETRPAQGLTEVATEREAQGWMAAGSYVSLSCDSGPCLGSAICQSFSTSQLILMASGALALPMPSYSLQAWRQ